MRFQIDCATWHNRRGCETAGVGGAEIGERGKSTRPTKTLATRPRGPVRASGRYCRRPAPWPGPASTRSAQALPCGDRLHRRWTATVPPRPVANRRPERFPDWTAVGFACGPALRPTLPHPFLGSAAPRRRLTPALGRRGCDVRLDGVLSTRGAGCVTSGDVNPDRRTARVSATRSLRVTGGPAGLAPDRSRALRRRRWPPVVAVPAIGCFARRRPDSVFGSVLQFRRSLSCPTTEGNIRRIRRIPAKNRHRRPAPSTVARNARRGQELHGG